VIFEGERALRLENLELSEEVLAANF